jgi:methyl-accepting chemotaxis protein
MKLSTKIVFGFILTNVVYFVLLAVIFVLVRPLEQASKDLVELNVPIYEKTAAIRYNVSEQRSNIRAYVSSPTLDRKLYEMAVENNKASSEAMDEINKILSDPRAAFLRTQEITGTYQKMLEAFKANVPLLQATSNAEENAFNSRMAYSEVALEMLSVLGDVLRAENETAQKEVTRPPAIKRRYDRLSTLTAIRASIYESWVLFLQGCLRSSQDHFNRSLAKVAEAEQKLDAIISETKVTSVRESLEKARKTMVENYEVLLKKVVDARNEAAALGVQRFEIAAAILEAAVGLNNAVHKEVLRFTDGIASTARQVSTSMFIGIVVALGASLILALFITRSIVKPINAIIGNLNESAHEVDSASSQLTTAANSLASGATENAASLEETSAALEELSSMTKRNADNASEAKALMGQANEIVGQATESMTKVIGAMAEISHSGNEIGKIIKTIDEIAFQTNLLALNAAVEAARAGEAGAGFAVVADEVRNLAIRSADAAKTTANLIEATIGNINSGSEMVNVSSEAFKAVSSQVGKVFELVSEVAEASGEQSLGIDQIAKAMSEMDKVTQSNAASAEESASEAEHLSTQAGSLLDVVSEMQALAYGSEKSQTDSSGGGRQALPPPKPKREPKAITQRPKARPAKAAATTTNHAMPMADDDDEFEF